ncbi:hypothetical protein ACGF0J_01325 [Nonomuraea sp. NPDC047897]|uniref:hypothetical protein n=1 Tax=Nonomuraea sp. NPDC047897 TaxID=3364346 RepID=UPI00371F26FA
MASRVGEELLPIFTNLRAAVDDTSVPAPAFSASGNLVFADVYRDTQRMAADVLDDAVDVIRGWQDTLMVTARNWRVAEDMSIVRYQ